MSDIYRNRKKNTHGRFVFLLCSWLSHLGNTSKYLAAFWKLRHKAQRQKRIRNHLKKHLKKMSKKKHFCLKKCNEINAAAYSKGPYSLHKAAEWLKQIWYIQDSLSYKYYININAQKLKHIITLAVISKLSVISIYCSSEHCISEYIVSIEIWSTFLQEWTGRCKCCYYELNSV